MTPTPLIFQQLGIALGLGLLVGLQREKAASRLAGFRTFPIITLLGSVSAILSQSFGGWVVAAAWLALAGVVMIGTLAQLKSKSQDQTPDVGLTTEAAALLMFGVGAYIVVGSTTVAIALAGAVAFLLYLKPQLHNLAKKIGDADFKAIMQFVLIWLVILPILPNRAFDPYNVLNPYKIWLMVVLIVGVSFAGYAAHKFFGQRAGIFLAGLLGGVISSTATTVSYARKSKQFPASNNAAAFVIITASAVVFLRVLVILAAVAPAILPTAAPPMLLMTIVFMAIAAALWFTQKTDHDQTPQHTNPTELKSALFFGLFYAVVLFAIAAAKENFGQNALYAVSALSGLVDMDAITLSTANMLNDHNLAASIAWRLILAASLSNLVFKAITIAILGNRKLFLIISALYAVPLAAGITLITLWPI